MCRSGPTNLVGSSNAGSSGSTSHHRQDRRERRVRRHHVAELLLEDVADHALGLRAEDVERVRLDLRVRRRLQRQQADLRAVAVGEHQLVLLRDGGQRRRGGADVDALVLGGHRLAALEQRVAAQRHHHAHRCPRPGRQSPSVATMTALIVCSRFSAWSKTIECSDSKTSSVTSRPSMPYSSKISSPTFVSRLWKAGRQCMNFTFGLPVRATTSLFTWYGVRSLIRSSQTLFVLAHRDPHVGVEVVDAGHALVDVLGQRQPGAGLLGDLAAGLDEVVVRPQVARRAQPDVHAELAAADHQRVAHVVAGVAQVAVGDVAQVLVAVLGHREDVGEDLGGVELVGEPVPDRHAGVLRQGLDRLLGEAAVLDPVEGPTEHPRGVLHRLLVTDLRAARLQVGDVRALVLRGDLERGAGPRRGLLEDQRDVLAGEARLLVAAVLGGLEVGGQLEQELQLLGREVELLEEAAVAEVERHRAGPSAQAGTAGGVGRLDGSGAATEDRRRMTSLISSSTTTRDSGDAAADAPLREA